MIRQKITKIINVMDITLLAKLNAFLLSCDSAEYNGTLPLQETLEID
jgi:hypothetical protein